MQTQMHLCFLAIQNANASENASAKKIKSFYIFRLRLHSRRSCEPGFIVYFSEVSGQCGNIRGKKVKIEFIIKIQL